MPNRPFEDFTESEIIDFVERFAAANQFEHAAGRDGEWSSQGPNSLTCRMRDTADKGRESSATVYLHLDAPQNCIIYSHRRGKLTWRIQDEQRQRPELFKTDVPFAGDCHKPTPEEEAQRAKEREAKHAAEAEAAEREFQANSAAALKVYEDALIITPNAASGPGVEYLKSKGVAAAPGVRLSWNKAGIFPPGALVVPFFDVLSGQLVTFQRIIPGAKGYEKGGFGGHAAAFWIVPGAAQGQPPETFDAAPAPKSAPLVILCEGFATGATCARLFGLPVGITGDTGKLENVARAILAAPSWGRTRLIIAADDDNAKTNEFKQTAGIPIAKKYLDNPPKNSGKDAALKAFNLDRARVYPAPPPWKWNGNTPEVEAARANPDKPPSDWNDFAAFYPDKAKAAAEESKAAAVRYFQNKQ